MEYIRIKSLGKTHEISVDYLRDKSLDEVLEHLAVIPSDVVKKAHELVNGVLPKEKKKSKS